MPLRSCIFVCGLLLLSGCSLVKLSDDISQANCTSDADCDVLNDHGAPDFTPCEMWQCSPATKLCEFYPLDQDHDQFTPASVTLDGKKYMCEVKPEKTDCNDDSAASKPNGKERCDDIDNDCDLAVDEGVLEGKSDVAVTFTGPNLDGAGDLSYAIDPGTGAVAIGYSINTSPNATPGFTLLKNDLPAGATATALEPAVPGRVLFADSVGVGSLGAGKFATAFFNLSGGGRLVAGTVVANTGDNPQLLATDDVLTNGLHCLPSEDCATKTPATQTPALAALGDDVLVTYVRAASDPSLACHAKADAVAANPLLANVLSVSADGLEEQTDAAVEIAKSSALEAPAVVTIPAATSGGAAFGWLVAYVNADGAIELRQVTFDGTPLEASGVLTTVSDAHDRFSGLRMALGPKDGDSQLVGLVFQRGCTVAARVGVVILKASVEGTTAKVAQYDGQTLVGGAANETHPAVAYAKDRKVWGVAYRDPAGLHARMLDTNRQLLGDAPYDLLPAVKSGSDMLDLLLSPILVASQGDGWFGALTYAQRSGATPQVIESVTVASCAKKD